MIGYDLDGVITVGYRPNPEDVIISGRSILEEPETKDYLDSIGLQNLYFLNPNVTKVNKNYQTSASWKIQKINELKITEFYENEPLQADLIRESCPNCTVYLIETDADRLLNDAISIQKQYYTGEIGKSGIDPEISNFTYFVYNHPEAPIFLPKNDYTIVVLLSGGIDSFVAYHYAKKKFERVVGLYIDYGYPYANVEKEAIQHLDVEVLPYEDHSYLSTFQQEGEKLWGEIFPGRNWLLAIIGSKYIKDRGEIWMSAIGGEVKKLWGDKSEYYFDNASKILSQYTKKQIRVDTPFKNLTKGQIVKWYLENGGSTEMIKKTVSCHFINSYNELPCGHCMGCAHRYIGMEWNGISEAHKNDVKSFAKKLYTNEINNPLSEFSTQRKKEIKYAIR